MSFINLRVVFFTNLIILPFILVTLPKPIAKPAALPAACHASRPIATASAGSPPKPPAERPYDVIVFGATGFTGRLAALYMQVRKELSAFRPHDGLPLRSISTMPTRPMRLAILY